MPIFLTMKNAHAEKKQTNKQLKVVLDCVSPLKSGVFLPLSFYRRNDVPHLVRDNCAFVKQYMHRLICQNLNYIETTLKTLCKPNESVRNTDCACIANGEGASLCV